MLHVPGFRPREVSALINQSVVEEHGEDAAMLWRMHEHGIQAPLYRLRDLELLDERVLAHLEALCVAGAVGMAQARRALATEEPSAVFVTAYLAFSTSETEAMRHVTQISAPIPTFADALISALSWIRITSIEQPLRSLARSENPVFRRLAVAVAAAHRIRMGNLYENAAGDANPDVRAIALRAIGETKSRDLEALVQDGVRASDTQSRFWAAWTMALLGDQRAAAVAFDTGNADPVLARTAIEIAMRAGEPGWARSVVRALAKNDASVRQAIVAAGAFGDPAAIPWLLSLMERPSLARVAAEAVAAITGVDLEAADFKQDPPEDLPDEHSDDTDLRWPSVQGLRDWWQKDGHRFQTGQRYLAGLPVSDAAAIELLRSGYQRQRYSAAIELAFLRPDAIVFPTGARADWQLGRLRA